MNKIYGGFDCGSYSENCSPLKAQQLDAGIQLRGANAKALLHGLEIFSLSHNFIIYDFPLLHFAFDISEVFVSKLVANEKRAVFKSKLF